MDPQRTSAAGRCGASDEPEHGSPRTSPKGSARRVSHEARMPADVATWRAASIFARTKLVNSSGVLGLASAP
jgi:hypothetical protein